MIAALTALAVFTPQDPAPGIDRALARARAATIRDVEYDLRFTFDERTDTVNGSVSIRFQFLAEGDRAPLVLDFAGSSITDVLVNNQSVELERRANHLLSLIHI